MRSYGGHPDILTAHPVCAPKTRGPLANRRVTTVRGPTVVDEAFVAQAGDDPISATRLTIPHILAPPWPAVCTSARNTTRRRRRRVRASSWTPRTFSPTA